MRRSAAVELIKHYKIAQRPIYFYYVSVNVVAGGIMFPGCSCVYPHVRASVPKHCYHDILSIR